MGIIRASSLIVAAGAALALATAGAANAQQTERLRGEVQSVDGNTVAVKTPDGKIATVALADNYRVTHATKKSLADIAPGDFVGTGALPDGDGWKALEVHIFPKGSRTGEGHRPWQPGAAEGGTMTNAAVSATVAGASKNQLTLNTGGKDFKINVPPDTPVVGYESGTKALVKKGAWVGVSNAVPQGNGKYTASAITVSDDRRFPPR
jgi:hypothetical protein